MSDQKTSIKNIYRSDALRAMFCVFAVMIFTTAIFVSQGHGENGHSGDVQNHELQTVGLLSNIDAYNINDGSLKSDAAIAHYNMGNIYYEKGEYELAAREYYQAIILMPNDPDSHYNLAFVSGDYLQDFRTALKHYKMYLYLNPKAKDRNLINEKIMTAELHLRSITDSPLENEIR